jgi:hypothetical protein
LCDMMHNRVRQPAMVRTNSGDRHLHGSHSEGPGLLKTPECGQFGAAGMERNGCDPASLVF